MKISFFAPLLLTGFTLAAAPEPSLRWDFSHGFNDLLTRQPLTAYDADGQAVSMPPIVTEDRIVAVKLDGKTLLRTIGRENGSQTIRVRVKFAVTPQGTLMSRHRPEDGVRGFELGLAGDKGFIYDGPKPSAMISGGGRDNLKMWFDPTVPSLRPGIWYEFWFRFNAGKAMNINIFEPLGRRSVCSGRIECPKIMTLTNRAGEKFLCFGGRRVHSKKNSFLLPAGTLLSNPACWNRALTDDELRAVTGIASTATVVAAPRLYYVDGRNGRDINDGLTPISALKTIQQAADLVRAGDTVIVQPGLYFEQVIIRQGGRAEAPIMFRAADHGFGSVTVTAADPAVRQGKVKWQLEDAALNLYSIPFGHNPARILYSGIDLLPYPTLDGLKRFMLLNGYPGAENGFFYAATERKLYVRLHPGGRYGSPDPNRHLMAIAPVNANGANGTQIRYPSESNIFIGVRTSAYVVIDGFTLETPGATGVATCGSNVVVRNCWFKGCRFGVFGVGSDDRRPAAVFVENCHYDLDGAFQDMVDVIAKWGKTEIPTKYRLFWWHRKGLYHDRNIFKNYETGLAGGVGRDWHVRDNVIENAFEASSSWAADRSENLQFYGNRLRRLIDNAVETENHNRNMRICFNRIEDVFEPFSWQPLGGLPWPGPVFIYRNIVTTSPELKQLWPTHTPGCFKIGASGRNWEHGVMGGASLDQLDTRISKRFVTVPYPGFMVFNNTIIFPYGRLLTTPHPTEGRARRELVNFRFFNNIFQVAGFHDKQTWDGSLLEFYANLFAGGNFSPMQQKLLTGGNGLMRSDLVTARLANPAQADFRLQPGSPALGRGLLSMGEIDADADLGAIPAGTDWQLSPGPGRGPKNADLSPFQRTVRYLPEPVRTAGPIPGIWGVYSPDHPQLVRFPIPSRPQTVAIVLRLCGNKGESKMMQWPELLTLKIVSPSTGKYRLIWNIGTAKYQADLPPSQPAVWQRLGFTMKSGEVLRAEWNGQPLSLTGTARIQVNCVTGPAEVILDRYPIADVIVK